MLILDLLYFLLLLISWPFWLTHVLKKSYRPLLKGRLWPQLDAGSEKVVWIHAVSVGEVRSLKSLIAALSKKGQRIVMSVTTPTGFDFARKEYPDIPVIHAPLDLSFIIRRFIDRIQPRLVIFNELEIWPNWISILNRSHIPILLINGRISEAAFHRYRIFGFILRPFFRRIDAYLVQNELYRKRFLLLGIPAEKITICGNIKADEADNSREGLPSPAEVRARLRLPELSKKIVILASSHNGDEKVFIPAIVPFGKSFFFIIVPRHVQRVAAIVAKLRRSGIRYSLFSRNEEMAPDTQILIYDRIGYLFSIMSIADIVFMGGTFNAATGSHNLYEPAALGKAIVGGPYYNNFPEIGRELEERGVYHRVDNSGEWLEYLRNYPAADEGQIKTNARKAIAKRKGSLACNLEWIQRYLA